MVKIKKTHRNKPTSQTQNAVELSCRCNHSNLLLCCRKASGDVSAKDHWRGPVQTIQNWLVPVTLVWVSSPQHLAEVNHICFYQATVKRKDCPALASSLSDIYHELLLGGPQNTDRNLSFTCSEKLYIYLYTHTHTLLFIFSSATWYQPAAGVPV